MSPSRPFIDRPVATALLMLAIVLAGLLGLRLLPLSALPEVDYPTIEVQTLYPGASPEVMGRTVTAPLERQLGQMSGLARMASSSGAGLAVIPLQFGLGLGGGPWGSPRCVGVGGGRGLGRGSKGRGPLGPAPGLRPPTCRRRRCTP